MSFKKFLGELSGEGVEGELLKTVLISLISSIVIFSLVYIFFLKKIPGFLNTYGIYVIFAIIIYSFILTTVRQITNYRQFACMAGMMIGMTVGMISGFMGGYLVGATNGMFFGSLFGIFLGVLLGIWMGKCCGVMGFMEGIMAGFMGGLMGAMTAVMMLNDHLKLAGLIFLIISIVILVSLNYMVYNEMKEHNIKLNNTLVVTVILSIILTGLTVWIMVFGPRSDLFV